MATSTDGVENGYIFQWKIDGMFHWWKLKNKDGIRSPVFISEKLKKTKWTLWFFPINEGNENNVDVYLQRVKDCEGPDVIEVSFQFTFLGKDGSVLKDGPILKNDFSKNENCGMAFDARERIFVTDREKFLPEDTLNVECTILITADEKPEKFDKLFATTIVKVKRSYFEWKIDRIDDIQSDIKNKFGDYLISCNIHLQEDSDRLCISLSDLNDSIKYISCHISIIDSEKRKESCGIQKYFDCDLRILPSIVTFTLCSETWMEIKDRDFTYALTFDFEFVFLTVEHSGCNENYVNLENGVVVNNSQITTVRNVDHYEQYSSITMNDIELRTFTRTFIAHRNFLSESSPVFERMISQELKGKNSGSIAEVYITDFEDDIVFQMLQYIYSNNLKNLQFDSANKLYKIADKYRILSLKTKCSSFFTENLCRANACKVLVLADLHDDLKKDVQDYILRHHKKIFSSEDWRNLMKTHLELAGDILYKKLTS